VIKRHCNFAISLVLLVIIAIALLFINQGKAMRSRGEISTLDPIYLPIVANRFPPTVFGISLYSFDSAGGLPSAVQAGISWSRKGFIWGAIEPYPGARLWDTQAELEQGLITANSLGIQPIMLIDGTPNWALKAGFSCGAVADTQLAALGQFAKDLVARYSVPPYNVRYWELWNEPDAAGILGCWGDATDTLYYGGYYYGQMMEAVYLRIKEADPNAQVLVGGLLLDCDPVNPPEGRNCVESRFLTGILQYSKDKAIGPNFDGVSFHAYDFYDGRGAYSNLNWHSASSTIGPVSIAKAHYLKSVLSSFGYGDRYLLNTENAVFWGENILTPPCNASPEDQANIEVTKVYHVVESYAAAISEGWKANVWYSMFGVRCSGLLNGDMSPKDSYYAYQYTRQKLGAVEFERSISDYAGIMGYEYESPGRSTWVIWSLDKQAHTILLPTTPLEVNRIGDDGRPVRVFPDGLMLNIGQSDLAPRFIEFDH
jgi:hypothetical protein